MILIHLTGSFLCRKCEPNVPDGEASQDGGGLSVQSLQHSVSVWRQGRQGETGLRSRLHLHLHLQHLPGVQERAGQRHLGQDQSEDSVQEN